MCTNTFKLLDHTCLMSIMKCDMKNLKECIWSGGWETCLSSWYLPVRYASSASVTWLVCSAWECTETRVTTLWVILTEPQLK